jgi:enoyl-CoA hydratase/carnithine racemase
MNDIVSECRDGLLRIALNRPQKRNALTGAMYEAIAKLVTGAQLDDSIHAVLFYTSGEHYSAGNDLQDFLDHPPTAGDGPQKRLMDALRTTDVPLIAAVRGATVGSGATMLTYCDFVYAGESTKLHYPFINLALVPEFATSFSLPLQVGQLRAAEIILLGEPFDAHQALAMGLVSAVLPDEDVLQQAEKTARKLAQKPQAALRASKRLMRHQLRPRLEQAVADELIEFSKKLREPDAREAITAFLEKRAPNFIGQPSVAVDEAAPA